MDYTPPQRRHSRSVTYLSNHPNDCPEPFYMCSRKYATALYGRIMKPSTARKINANSECYSMGKIWLSLKEAREAGYLEDPSSLLVAPLISVKRPSSSGVHDD